MEAALEWQRWQDQVCSGCGNPRDECMDPDGPQYAAKPLRCRACEARDAAAREFAEAKGDNAGLYFAVDTFHGGA